MRDVVTFVLTNVKHSSVHRPTISTKVKARSEGKEPREVGPDDETISMRSGGTTVIVRDSKVAGRCVGDRRKAFSVLWYVLLLSQIRTATSHSATMPTMKLTQQRLKKKDELNT